MNNYKNKNYQESLELYRKALALKGKESLSVTEKKEVRKELKDLNDKIETEVKFQIKKARYLASLFLLQQL